MGEAGFFDTLDAVKEARLEAAGVGACLDDARRGRLVERRGLRFVFLSYSQLCNSHFASLAAHDYPGILPLDRALMKADVQAARRRADFVVVSVHWGFEDQPNVHPQQVEIAHLLVDAGADCILGHHSHCPHAIEIYRERPIFYSLGNLIFGLFWRHWRDNVVAEIVIDGRRIEGVVVHPIATATPEEQFQPAPVGGSRAGEVLRGLQLKSAIFGTGIAVHRDKGYIRVAARQAD
jgi:poly-gamma-glutamate capsule biosynthesis protein CapA/YwtB (metallophosphatase superfamily)